MKALLLLCLAFSLASCSKFGRTVTLKGRVVNPITGQGYEGAEIHIKRSEMFKLPGGNKIVKTKTSDTEGYFEISKSGFNHYFADAWVSEDYYMLGWFKDGECIGGNSIALKVGKKINADFHVVPYGNLKIAVHNVNCQGANDTLHFERNYITDPNNSVFLPFTFTGCYDNNGAFAKVPSGYYNIKWTVIRSGISNTYEQQILVPGNGNYEMVINY